MTQDSKNIVNNFLIKHFSVKRAKNKKGKWDRVIIITHGYISQMEKRYKWDRGQDNYSITLDLIQLLINVFSITKPEAEELVYCHMENIKL